MLVVFGVGAIIGDGVLTPAISVLSSIEGLYEVTTISQGKKLFLCAIDMLCAALRHMWSGMCDWAVVIGQGYIRIAGAAFRQTQALTVVCCHSFSKAD